MPGKVTMILEATQQTPAEERMLRVAPYCCVSTKHEEQQHSLAAQINHYTNYTHNHLNWVLVEMYSDPASGINTNQRPGYEKRMRDCAESHFRSENIKLGIHHGMRSGKTVLNHTQFLGYTKGSDGAVQIVPEEAEIVRKIFDRYIQGNGIGKIKRYPEEHEIKTVTGKSEWSASTIDRVLSYPIFKDEALSPPPAVRRNAPAGGDHHRAVRQCGGSSWARQGLPAQLSPNEACLLSE